uniref:Uncharacterized protein n=1 Tax=Arundo donax TaxID=35708 RepID=A0A0A9GT66_ARUDO
MRCTNQLCVHCPETESSYDFWIKTNTKCGLVLHHRQYGSMSLISLNSARLYHTY